MNGRISVSSQAECDAAAAALGADLYQVNVNNFCKYVMNSADCDTEEELGNSAKAVQIYVVGGEDEVPCMIPSEDCYLPPVGVSCPSTTRVCDSAESFCVDGKISVSTQAECFEAATALGAQVYQYNFDTSNCKFSTDGSSCDEQSETSVVSGQPQILDINSVDGTSIPCLTPTPE